MAYRFRKPNIGGPEQEMVNNFLTNDFPFQKKEKLKIFEQPELPVGYPDVVAVCYKKQFDGLTKANRVPLPLNHIKVLHYLFNKRWASHEFISDQLLVHPKEIETILADLLSAEMIYCRGTKISIRSLSKIFFITKIISIEAKIQNWRKAIIQASTNTWFASHSYILIPPNRNIELIIEEAERRKVGVLIYDLGKTTLAVKAEEQKIPSSYGSWIFNELLIQPEAI